MGTRGFLFAFATFAFHALCIVASRAEDSYGAAPDNIKEHLDRLVRSYPDQIVGYDAEFLILKNGVKFRISDGRTNKTFQELLERPDIDDMFYARYPVGAEPIQPAKRTPTLAEFVLRRCSSPCMAIVTRATSPKIYVQSTGFPSTAAARLRSQLLMALLAHLKTCRASSTKCRTNSSNISCQRAGPITAEGSPAHARDRCTPTGPRSTLAPNLPTIGGGIQPTGLNPGGETASRLRLCGFSKNKAPSGWLLVPFRHDAF